MEEERVRIQKFLSQKGLFSRREAEGFIRAGRLKIDGKAAMLGDRVNGLSQITLDGKDLQWEEKIARKVIAFYKPRGVECTLAPVEGAKTLLDFDFRSGRVFPMGRLDKDSHGLLFLTNDGAFSNQLMHPKFQKEKEYYVVLNKNFDQAFITSISRGVEFVPEKTSKPCFAERLEEKVFRIVLTEGRNRQIRKMCEKLGYEVKDLLRVRIGSIHLGEMKSGKFRFLSKTEVKSLEKL